jgi:hypothetical protein
MVDKNAAAIYNFFLRKQLMSQLVDLNYVEKPVIDFNLHIVASPEYIDANAKIRAPSDLT